MILHFGLFIVGFLMLYYGAGWLVKGSSSLARSMGLTPLVIGLTVVAFGTSAPELLVSVISSIKGKSMIAVGNVIGSNIFNVLVILGISARHTDNARRLFISFSYLAQFGNRKA